jgi:hypothetical protein
MEIYRAGQDTDDIIAHAHCMLDNCGYTHTLTVYSTYCFTAATLAAMTRLNVMFKRTLRALLYSTKPSRTEWYPPSLLFCVYMKLFYRKKDSRGV